MSARADSSEPPLVDDYYQISTAEQLLWFANYVNSGNTTAKAELTDDIVLNENLLDKIDKGETENLVTWIPIGTYENSFRGSFKSNYHTISGLYVNNPTLDCVGFFGCTWGRNNLMHISINDSYFAGHDYVGGIIGYRDGNGYADDWGYGHLSNSYFRGTVFGNNYVGGIAGYTETFMHSCYVVANVSGNSNVGAIIGSKGEKKMPPFRDFYYDNSLTTPKALGYTVADDAENNVIGKASASFHNGEIAYLMGLRQDLSDPDSYPEYEGKYVHQNLDGNGYHNPEYVDGHCSHCIKYKYKIPEQDDNGVYQISTADELYGFMHLVNTGDNHINAVLTNDIVVNENVLEKVHSGNTDGLREWYSIGWQAYAGYILNNCQYAGVFDGNFHTISGLYFDSKIKEEGQVGLFANVLGTIKNVIVKDAFFKGICTIGGITNNIGNDGFLTTNPVIENCIFDGEIVSERPCGGICCMALRATASCESYGSITIKNCINIGKIISESNYTGGILGTDWSNKTSVINCYNAGEIKTGDWLEVGGICGSGGVHTITNCYNTGKISHGFSIYCNNRLDGGNAINSYNNQDICNLHLVLNDNYIGNTTTATLCNGTLPEGFSSDDWIAGKTETADNGTTTYTFPHLKVFDGKYPAFSIEYKQPVSIKVETIPTKVEYNEGEKFDATGIKIVFVYADESTMAVDDITNFTFPCLITFTDFNNIKLGEQTITVKYKGEAIGEFTVTVKETTSEPAIVNGVYQITSASKLLWFANYVNSGNTNAQAELIDDIVLNENLLDKIDKGETENLVTWIPIGTEDNSFSGSFKSNYHTISGLYVNNPEQDYVGLFGYCAGENTLSLISINDSYFAGHDYVGGVIGYSTECGEYNDSRLASSYFRGAVSGNRYVGGIAGYTQAPMSGCYVVANVTGKSNAGAFIGGKGEKELSFSWFYYDNTILTTLKAFGFTGKDDEENNVVGKSSDLFHTGEIAYLMGLRQDLSDPDSYPEYEGKYVHQNLDGNGYHNPEYEEGHCKYCFNYTYKIPEKDADGVYQISTADELYGFMNLVNSGENNADAVLTADIMVNENVLEKVHSGNTAGLREWYSIGDNGYAGFVETNCEYGGVFDGNYHTISGLYYDSKLNGNSQRGLFSGVNNTVKNVIVKDTYFKSLNNTSGGIAGYIQGAYGSNISPVIENCIFDGEIDAVCAGGIVYTASTINGGTIKNCINLGKISGKSFTGGILGADYGVTKASIINCYNAGEVVCTDNTVSSVGGICGGAGVKAITNCYNTGKILLGYSIMGLHWSSPEITNIYNNQDICYLPLVYNNNFNGNTTTAALCNGTLPEGFSSDDWIAGKTETDDNGTITFTFPHLKVFDGKYPAYSITKPSVKSIAIKTPPSQTEYALGEDLNKDGLVVTFTYSDHTTIDVDYYGSYDQTSTEFQLNNSLMVSDFDNTSTGKKTVTITYNDDLTAEFDVTVVDKGKCGYQYLDEDGTLTFYYGNYRNGAGYIGESGCSKSFENKKVKKAVFDPSFIEFKPTNLSGMFGFYPNLQEIVDMDKYLNTEEVVNMAWMFGCCPLTTLDLSTFDTRKVKYMNGMFADFSGQTNFKTIYVGDKWSTENVEPCMMFLNCTNLVGEKGTKCNNEGRWDNTDLLYARVDGGEDAPGYFTYKAVVTPVDTIFTAPKKLTYIEGEELDLTGGVITITFNNGETQTIALSDENVAISDFDNTKIGEQDIYVRYSTKTFLFKVNVEAKSTEKEAYAVFDESEGTLTFYYDANKPEGAYGMRTNEDDGWSKVSDQITKVVFKESFADYRPTSCAYWFDWCYNSYLTSIDLSNLNTENVTDMSYMFANCGYLTSIDVSKFNTENVTDMNAMFNNCGSLTSIDLSSFNTKNVTDMSVMFMGCESLTSIVLSNLNTENVTDMSYMFAGCSITSLDVSGFNTNNVTDMSLMFWHCRNLTSIDLSNFNTENVTDMCYMFSMCRNLQTIYVGNDWSTNAVTSSESMFEECTSLVGGKGTTYDENHTDITYARIDGGEDAPGYFTYKAVVTPIDTTITAPTKLTYLEGEELDLTDGKITIVFSDETTQPIALTNEDVTLSGFDNTKAEEQTITVIYKGETVGTFTVNVKAIEAVSIAITTDPEKLTYLEGDNLNLTGGVITVTYNNDETRTVALTDEKVTVAGFVNNKIGEQPLTVSYLELTTTINVRVEAKSAIALELIQLPVKIHYYQGDAFMPDGGEFVVTYNNKTSEILDLGKAKITGFDSNKLGEQTLIVDFMGQKAEIKITVAARPNPNPYTEPTTKDDVYQISTAQDLFWFVTEVNSGHTDLNAVLVNDIVINQDLWKQLNKTTKAEPQLTEWNPIGTLTNAYSGTFDGQGHTISGVYFNDDTQDNVGLFGVITEKAVIKNLGVTDSYIKGDENVGAICGSSEGTILNCYTTSIIEGNTNVGAISGAINETAIVANSYSLGKATKSDGTEQGVTGTAATQNVQNCYYLTENASTTDSQAKTAQQFKSGEVTELLKQPVSIGGVEYKNEILATVTELPGVDEITVPTDPENPNTAVSEISNTNIRIWSFGNTVYVENAVKDIYIVNLSGSLITKRTPDNNRMEISLNNKGVYIVKTGNVTQKIIIQ